jgi:hypothetical protein
LILISGQPAVLTNGLGELIVSANPWIHEDNSGGRDTSAVKKLPLLFTDVTYLGASGSGIKPQEASGSRIRVERFGSSGIQQQTSDFRQPIDECDIYIYIYSLYGGRNPYKGLVKKGQGQPR